MMEPFSIIDEVPEQRLFDKFEHLTSGKSADHDIQYQSALRERFSELSLTAVPANNCSILAFAGAGNAELELDTTTDPVLSWRGWLPSYGRSATATIGQTIFFAKYHLKWNGEDFILYVVGGVQYILKEPRGGETVLTPSRVTDELIKAVGIWQSSDRDIVWVYDNFWRQDKSLWEQVAKAKWENVILDENMKKDLTSVSNKFFDNEDVYKDLGVPWKRGIIFHGPAGNGKTVSIKALMHTLHDRKTPVQSLYVKSAQSTYAIGQIFQFARRCAPCMLIFEDIETIINNNTRSYFLNEVDGLESNDGILMVASTNFLDRLDPGITKRPSRFDRKYLFPLPNLHERTLYAQYWRRKVVTKDSKRVQVDFPLRLCAAMATITNDFSFAYMQEAFVATLLTIAREEVEIQTPPELPAQATFRPAFVHSAASQALYNNLNPACGYNREPFADLDEFRVWRIFKDQVQILRGDMDKSAVEPSTAPSAATSSSMRPITPPSAQKKPYTMSVHSKPASSTTPTDHRQIYSTPPHAPTGLRGPEGQRLQDYQMQLMLLEQQNKKRLLQSRQERDHAQLTSGISQYGQPAVMTHNPVAGLPEALAKLGVDENSKPDRKIEFTQALPSLPRPDQASSISPTFDLPAEGSAGRKWPALNSTSFTWGPR